MSLLKSVEVSEANGKIAEIYEEITGLWGGVPNPIKLLSVNPDALENLWSKLKYQMKLDSPSQKMLSMVRLLVSQESECEYCVGANASSLINNFGLSADEVRDLKIDPTSAPLDEKEKALLLFTLKAVHDSHRTNAFDIKNLHTLGWNDKEILDAVNSGITMLSTDILINAFNVEIDY